MFSCVPWHAFHQLIGTSFLFRHCLFRATLRSPAGAFQRGKSMRTKLLMTVQSEKWVSFDQLKALRAAYNKCLHFIVQSTGCFAGLGGDGIWHQESHQQRHVHRAENHWPGGAALHHPRSVKGHQVQPQNKERDQSRNSFFTHFLLRFQLFVADRNTS